MVAETAAETVPHEKAPQAPIADQAREPWHVVGSESLVVTLMAAAKDRPVVVKESDGQDLAANIPGSIAFVEWTDAARAPLVEAALGKGMPVVAIVPEPTVANVARLLRLGVTDIIAGKPAPAVYAERAARWRPRPSARPLSSV